LPARVRAYRAASPELGVPGRPDVTGVVVTEGRLLDVVDNAARDVVERLNGFFSGGRGGAESLALPAFANAFFSEAKDDFFVGPAVSPDSLGVDGVGNACRPNPCADMDESSEATESVRAWNPNGLRSCRAEGVPLPIVGDSGSSPPHAEDAWPNACPAPDAFPPDPKRLWDAWGLPNRLGVL
jgi:hypothetical protein